MSFNWKDSLLENHKYRTEFDTIRSSLKKKLILMSKTFSFLFYCENNFVFIYYDDHPT
jgi:hypothetical protein